MSAAVSSPAHLLAGQDHKTGPVTESLATVSVARRRDEISQLLSERAEVLAQYRSILLGCSSDTPPSQVVETLDRFSGAVLLWAHWSMQESGIDHSDFALQVLRSTSALKERASALATMSDADIVAQICTLHPSIQPDDLVEIKRFPLAVIAVVKLPALLKLEYEEGDCIKRGVSGLHLNGTPISLAREGDKLIEDHEMVHNLNDASSPLQHAIPKERLQHLVVRGDGAKHPSVALPSQCIDDLHEELVAQLIALSEQTPAKLLLMHFECVRETFSARRHLSTAGERIHEAAIAALDHGIEIGPGVASSIAIELSRHFYHQGSEAFTLLTAASLCGTTTLHSARMLLYVTKPHQWGTLRRTALYAYAREGIEEAYAIIDCARKPWFGDSLDRLSSLLKARPDRIELSSAVAEEATCMQQVSMIDSPSRLAEAEAALEQLLLQCGNPLRAFYHTRLRHSFDTLYPHHYPERAKSYPDDVY